MMDRTTARSMIPWVAGVAVTTVLALGWFELYLVNVQLIAKGVLTQVNRNQVLDKTIVDYSGLAAALIVIAGVAVRTRGRSVPLLLGEILTAVRRDPEPAGKGGAKKSGWRMLLSIIFRDVLLLGRMGECEDFQQWFSHFLIMWGFIGLAATTTLDALVNSAANPLPIWHPVRVLGNATGIMLIAGLTIALTRRLTHTEVRLNSRPGDWVFLASLYGTALTGFIVQFFADTGVVTATIVFYPVHLAFISFLLVTAPWTKFIHALWRPSWIAYSRLRGNVSEG